MSAIPRHIIVDLIPLYLADDLSAETRRVVDDFLQTDKEFAAFVRMGSAGGVSPDEGITTAHPAPDVELRSVQRTRSLLTRQRWLFGLALAFSAVGLSLAASYRDGRVTSVHLMVLDYPLPFGICLVAALGCWLGYHRSRRHPSGWRIES